MTVCWIITEKNLPGTENQCLAVAEALEVTPVVRHIGLRQPWKTLSPWLGFERRHTFTGDELAAPWPDILIAAGRKAIAAARYIKKKSPRTFTVFLQNPHINPRHFDLVAAAAHDNLYGRNVLTTQGSPNLVTPARLAEARKKFTPLLAPLPAPRVAVLIGGNSNAHSMTHAVMEALATRLKALSDEGCGLMITASRRTPPSCREILSGTLTPPAGRVARVEGPASPLYIWNGEGENPYHGFLAWADYIIVTADSASMISDAATTGKPVYMAPLEGGSARFDRLHKGLLEKGVIRKFEGRLEHYNYTPLNDAAMVAAEIRKRMKS